MEQPTTDSGIVFDNPHYQKARKVYTLVCRHLVSELDSSVYFAVMDMIEAYGMHMKRLGEQDQKDLLS